jgi:hypothetical protein
MSITKLSLDGNNLIISASLVSDIPAEDGNFFLQWIFDCDV